MPADTGTLQPGGQLARRLFSVSACLPPALHLQTRSTACFLFDCLTQFLSSLFLRGDRTSTADIVQGPYAPRMPSINFYREETEAQWSRSFFHMAEIVKTGLGFKVKESHSRAHCPSH